MAQQDRRLRTIVSAIADPAVELPSRAEAALRQVREAVTHENILGFGIGEKLAAGAPTGELGITFLVRRKLFPEEVDARRAIPPVLADSSGRAVFTDVLEVGDVRAHANVDPDPVRSGYSVGHISGAPGTLGALVMRRGVPYALSAQHVLTNHDRGLEGDLVLFPAAGDGGRTPGQVIGQLGPYKRLDLGQGYPNRVDAALVRLTPTAAARVDADVADVTRPATPGRSVPGMIVSIVGRTSGGPVRSVVRTVGVSVELYYSELGYVGFKEQVHCDPIGQPGDSGALVVDVASGRVVGLHVGGSPQASFFTPIETVLGTLGCKLA